MTHPPESQFEPISYRFSGHETFACRYAWLPKAAQGVEADPTILTALREDHAMVELGVGKNMVRSIRYWAESADIIRSCEGGHEVTAFGRELIAGYGSETGLDPYLEDIQSLWLLHWKLATNSKSLIVIWNFLLNHFQEPDLYSSSVVRAFGKDLPRYSSKEVSKSSQEQLWDVFLHSYVPTRGRKGEVREDSLDCPLIELDLLRPTGVTMSALKPGRVEAKYAFRREEKPEIGQSLFAFCLHDFWQNHYSTEQSIPFHSVVVGHGSPGQVFKIPEPDIRSRLVGIREETEGFFDFEESAAIPRIVRRSNLDAPSMAKIYAAEVAV